MEIGQKYKVAHRVETCGMILFDKGDTVIVIGVNPDETRVQVYLPGSPMSSTWIEVIYLEEQPL